MLPGAESKQIKNEYPLSAAATAQVRLPVRGRRNILVTSALPYVNNVPHLGNLIGCVLSADAFTRFARLRGYNVLFLSGADEFGTATELKAAAEGVTCQELCDRYFVKHKHIYDWFGIEFDHFGRTTNPFHRAITHEIYEQLRARGFVYERDLSLPFCTQCNRNLSDRLVHGTCPHCGAATKGDQCDACEAQLEVGELLAPKCGLCGFADSIRWKVSKQHVFLDQDKIAPLHLAWLASVKDTWSEIARSTTLLALNTKARSICISRELRWGTPIPGSPHVFHCWFDAPIGYLSITADYLKQHGADPELWRTWWQQPQPMEEQKKEQTDLYQFMGKDNITFHAINFPSTLLAATSLSFSATKETSSPQVESAFVQTDSPRLETKDAFVATKDTTAGQGQVDRSSSVSELPEQVDKSASSCYRLVKQICSTHHLKYEGVKFSKSDGVGVFGDQAEATGLAADVFRFYLFSSRPENADTGFYWAELQAKNNFLREKLGSLVTRVLSNVHRRFQGVLPPLGTMTHTEDQNLMATVNVCLAQYVAHFEKAQIALALEDAKKLVDLGHEYLSRVQPYSASTSVPRIASCLHLSVNLLRQIAIVFQPFIPASVAMLCDMLNLPVDSLHCALESATAPEFQLVLRQGHCVKKAYWIFQTPLTDEAVANFKRQFGSLETT